MATKKTAATTKTAATKTTTTKKEDTTMATTKTAATNSSVILSAKSGDIELTIKSYTAARYDNFAACDKQYYFFSADWREEQEKKVCSDALARTKKIMKYITAYDEDMGWGKKDNTGDAIAAFNTLLGKVKLGTDNRTNSFTMYQVERFLNRTWYRGTKEQRAAADEALGLTPKKETKQTTKRTAKAKAAPAPKAEAAPSSGLTAEEKALLMKLIAKLAG